MAVSAGFSPDQAPADRTPPIARAISPNQFGFAAGLAALTFGFPLYRLLNLYQAPNFYFIEGLPDWAFAGSVVLSVAAVLALVLALCFGAMRAGVSAKTVERTLAAAVLVEAAFSVKLRLGLRPAAFLPLAILAAGAGALGTRPAQIARTVLSRICLILVIACFAVLAFDMGGAVLSQGAPKVAGFLPSAATPRLVVVLLFDELDEELAFSMRPGRIGIPNLTEFDGEAVHATRVSPVAEMTVEAIPSLLTGHVVAQAEPRSRRRLDLYGANGEKTVLDGRDTVFAKLRRAGFNNAVLGWHHPYCQVFGSEVARCESFPNLDATSSLRVARYFGEKKGLTLLPPFGNPATTEELQQYAMVAQEQYRQIESGIRAVSTWIADRRIGFLWAHFPCPHPPGMVTGAGNHGPANYFDNLELVDKIVGAVVLELKRSGRWEDSVVALTGDHGLRRKVWVGRPVWTREENQLLNRRTHEYVPLIMHLPRQAEHVSWDRPLSALVLHHLILEWVQGRLARTDALAEWLAGQSR